MKAIITGSKGFIGSHLSAELKANGYDVIDCDVSEEDGIVQMDILNQGMVFEVLSKHQPDILFNLAGQANVGLSWKKPQSTVELNTVGSINIMEAIRVIAPNIRLIAIGSSDEYGSLKQRGTNVTEDMPVRPITPYAISKLTQELFAKLYVHSYGMDICMIRLFNLGGPRQSRGYLISDFASEIAEVEAGKKEYISVGNLESARDFTHVVDACKAIRLIAEKGHTGEVYNISSGRAHRVKEVLDQLLSMAMFHIDVYQDPKRIRPSDTPVICGNHDKLTAHTGWNPEIPINQILSDALRYWRESVS